MTMMSELSIAVNVFTPEHKHDRAEEHDNLRVRSLVGGLQAPAGYDVSADVSSAPALLGWSSCDPGSSWCSTGFANAPDNTVLTGTIPDLYRFCWILLLLITVSLLLWYNRISKTEEAVLGLRGYVRISPSFRFSSKQYLGLHCARCAVVSSSGQVLGSRRGREINSHGCVIRMNAAPTQGFEADVGNKTTVRVVAHSSVRRLLHREAFYFNQEANTHYVVWGPERNMRQDGKGRVFNMLVKLSMKYPGARIYTVSREKMMQCDRVFQNETGKNRMKSGAFLSTGFFTMIFALDVCNSINVYGMIDGSYCSLTNSSSVPYHYYEPNRLDECSMYRVHEHVQRGGHRFITEKQIYGRWASQGKLKFQYPAW